MYQTFFNTIYACVPNPLFWKNYKKIPAETIRMCISNRHYESTETIDIIRASVTVDEEWWCEILEGSIEGIQTSLAPRKYFNFCLGWREGTCYGDLLAR